MIIKQQYNENNRITKIDARAKNVAFLVNNSYVKFLSVILIQLSKNTTSSIEIILLHDGLKKKNEKRIITLCNKIKFHINFVNVKSTDVLKAANTNKEYWFPSVTKKILLITDFFKGIGTILYLDIDISIINNIDEIFLLKNCISGVIELASTTKKALEWKIPKKIITPYVKEILSNEITLDEYFTFINVSNYVNAGILLVNPDICHIKMDLSEATKYIYNDQDYINMNFDNDINILDYKWNLSASFLYNKNSLAMESNFLNVKEHQKFMNSLNDMRIVHYAGHTKPWEAELSSKEIWDIKWYESFKQSNFKYDIILYNALYIVKRKFKTLMKLILNRR